LTGVEHWGRALEPYKHLDPTGWVGLFRFFPLWAGIVAVLGGVLLLTRGGGGLFRFIAGPLGLLIGQIWIGPVAARFGFGAYQSQIALVSSAVLGVLGLIAPAATVFFGFGVPIALMAANLAGPSDWLLGFVPAFIIAGALGVVLERVISILLATCLGAWLVLLGGMASAWPFLPTWVDRLAASWPAAIAVAACFATAGFGYQAFVLPPPEKAAQLRREKKMAKQAAAERKALEKRWANYSRSSGKD
jgi:hypothetical protein